MFKKIALDRVRLRNRIAPYECRMRFALNRMTISHDRMTALHNRMRIVFDRVQERGFWPCTNVIRSRTVDRG